MIYSKTTYTLMALLSCSIFGHAQMLSVQIPTPSTVSTSGFKLGTSRSPSGHVIGVSNRSLLFDGQPAIPVMGEIHYSRYPQNEWREELLKMKAGGIDIIATYVFWIHHEEEQGKWDWTGPRDLRKFIQLCKEIDLKVVVRCGPWCHGEVRNGGLPDWVKNSKEFKPRTEQPAFLDIVRILYKQIDKQLDGLLWKDDGPVIGIQADNEFRGPSSYLLKLKQIAREEGLDVPIYTRTGWPNPTTPMPFGELLPLYGGYAEGFWERSIAPMPGDKWTRFIFKNLRTDTEIGSDQLGNRKAEDAADISSYPYLTCESGGGMADSYHRRILMLQHDVESLMMIQIGSGSSLPGYYMYHGGVNPDGKLSTLNESVASGYPNDLPVKSYDFQAPLGEYGQVRESYHRERRLHLFLKDFGAQLANMPATIPPQPKSAKDLSTLRWSVRSNGTAGFVFINNYQRLQPMPPKNGVQFEMLLPSGKLTFPTKPITIPADQCFFWPFNFDLGHGVKLDWATAQPICYADEGDTRTVFFAETPGVSAQFAENGKLHDVTAGHDTSLILKSPKSGNVRIVLLDDADSLALWKGKFNDCDQVVLTPGEVQFDGSTLHLKFDGENPQLDLIPSLTSIKDGNRIYNSHSNGVFSNFDLSMKPAISGKVSTEAIRPAGPAPEIHKKGNLPIMPREEAFKNAAVWRIKIPNLIDIKDDPILRIRYVGDIARITLNGQVLTDQFYNGRELEIGLNRHAPEILSGDLQLEILPLRKDMPIYLAKEAWPDFGVSESVADLKSIELLEPHQMSITSTTSLKP